MHVCLSRTHSSLFVFPGRTGIIVHFVLIKTKKKGGNPPNFKVNLLKVLIGKLIFHHR
nr:MAG TPA: hypothetical protein [Caudoviricetes sp.]